MRVSYCSCSAALVPTSDSFLSLHQAAHDIKRVHWFKSSAGARQLPTRALCPCCTDTPNPTPHTLPLATTTGVNTPVSCHKKGLNAPLPAAGLVKLPTQRLHVNFCSKSVRCAPDSHEQHQQQCNSHSAESSTKTGQPLQSFNQNWATTNTAESSTKSVHPQPNVHNIKHTAHALSTGSREGTKLERGMCTKWRNCAEC